VSLQILFSDLSGPVFISDDRFCVFNNNVRNNSPGLDRFPCRRIILCDRQFESRTILQRNNGLYRSLSKALSAQQYSPLVVVKRFLITILRRTGGSAVESGIITGHRGSYPSSLAVYTCSLSFALPFEDTITPDLRNISDTFTDWFRSPPGLFLKSRTSPFRGTSFVSISLRALSSSSAVVS